MSLDSLFEYAAEQTALASDTPVPMSLERRARLAAQRALWADDETDPFALYDDGEDDDISEDDLGD